MQKREEGLKQRQNREIAEASVEREDISSYDEPGSNLEPEKECEFQIPEDKKKKKRACYISEPISDTSDEPDIMPHKFVAA